MCVKIWSDTCVQVIPVDQLQRKCIVNPTTTGCSWDSDSKVAAIVFFSGAGRLFWNHTDFFLILINLRKVIFRKQTKPRILHFRYLPFPKATLCMWEILCYYLKLSGCTQKWHLKFFDFLFLIKFILPQSTSLLKLNFCKRFHLYQLSYHQTLKQLFLK